MQVPYFWTISLQSLLSRSISNYHASEPLCPQRSSHNQVIIVADTFAVIGLNLSDYFDPKALMWCWLMVSEG